MIGPDDRKRVPNPAHYPWRINSSLQILAPDNTIYVGTGWFIGPHTLVTAGHCVFIHDRWGRFKDWARAIRVMPGRDGKVLPHKAITTSNFWSVAGWVRDADPRYDYAAIILPTDLGDEVGWTGIEALADKDLIGKAARISGYPADKIGDEDGTQWYDDRQILAADVDKLYYQIDTWGGQSGSAVHIVAGEKPFAVGIHAYGDNVFGNSATRINSAVYENLESWKA